MPAGAMEIATDRRESAASATRSMAPAILHEPPLFLKSTAACKWSVILKPPKGRLILRMRAGVRFVYKLVDQVDERIAGHSPWWDMHTALLVREEEFFPNYRRMWEGLPEEAGPKEHLNDSRDKEDAFPARTGLHRSPVGLQVERNLSARR